MRERMRCLILVCLNGLCLWAAAGLLEQQELTGLDEIVFVKRHTYNANHYYTEFINSTWMPGGNICVLNLKTGAVRELLPQMTGGVFGRFDLRLTRGAWFSTGSPGRRKAAAFLRSTLTARDCGS